MPGQGGTGPTDRSALGSALGCAVHRRVHRVAPGLEATDHGFWQAVLRRLMCDGRLPTDLRHPSAGPQPPSSALCSTVART